MVSVLRSRARCWRLDSNGIAIKRPVRSWRGFHGESSGRPECAGPRSVALLIALHQPVGELTDKPPALRGSAADNPLGRSPRRAAASPSDRRAALFSRRYTPAQSTEAPAPRTAPARRL